LVLILVLGAIAFSAARAAILRLHAEQQLAARAVHRYDKRIGAPVLEHRSGENPDSFTAKYRASINPQWRDLVSEWEKKYGIKSEPNGVFPVEGRQQQPKSNRKVLRRTARLRMTKGF